MPFNTFNGSARTRHREAEYLWSHPVVLCLLLVLTATACSNSDSMKSFSYDPEGANITTDKEIQPQYRQTIGIVSDSVWISNEFPGGRMNDFYRLNDSTYRVVIEPENFPVNNSPWYAFKLWSGRDQTVDLQLVYRHGDHRYYPDISRDRKQWSPAGSQRFASDTLNGTATLSLPLSKDTTYVAAQELLTRHEMDQWIDSLALYPYVTRDTVGYSHEQRPITRLTVTDAPEQRPRGVVILITRLHPPEVTGSMAFMAFMKELSTGSELATRFRNRFEVLAYPLANPDGVQQGHWRHNAGGVDLNRDWIQFNQPETRAIRDDLMQRMKANPDRRVYYGIDFHSTDENIFYPINREVNTFPEDFTFRWLDSLTAVFPEVPFAIEPFDTQSPIAKNWIHRTFGADAVTYEVNDRADRDTLRSVARRGARLMMRMLLEEQASEGDEQTIK